MNYILSGKLKCAYCGIAMVGESGTSATGRTYNYYKCLNHKRGNGCKLPAIPKEKLERQVGEDTRNYVLQDDIIRHIAHRAVELQRREAEFNEKLHILEAQQKDIAKSIANIVRAIETGTISDTLTTRLAELENQKEALDVEIAKQKIKMPIITEDQIVFWLSQFKHGDITDEDYLGRLIDMLISKIVVSEKEITIVYNYCNDGSSDNVELVTRRRFELRTP